MNSVKSQNSIYRNLLCFYTLIKKFSEKKIKKTILFRTQSKIMDY